MPEMEFVSIPAGIGGIGSTAQEVEACVRDWSGRLAEPEFTEELFRTWLAKEIPRHPVSFEAFRLGRFPVTNTQYREFIEDAGGLLPESIESGQAGDCPVWGVSYDECERFASWFGNRLGKRCRLPTEAEWEYAARGPNDCQYPFGNEFDPAKCNTLESGIGHITSVHAYEAYPSGFGVCDLAGNVEEWTASRYSPYENGSLVEDELTAQCGANYRVLRGGSFCRTGDLTRCARRHGPHPGSVYRYRGFRIRLAEE